MPDRFYKIVFVAAVFVLLAGCQPMINSKEVLGTWVIRKDSTEMKVTFTPDSVTIAYLPGKTRYRYAYEWKQDEEPGLMECYQEVALDSEKLARKIIPSRMFITRVTADSISLYLPKLKTLFRMKREITH